MSVEFQAHGAHATVGPQQITVRYSVLQRALGHKDCAFALTEVREQQAPSDTLPGVVDFGDHQIVFAPGADDEQRRFVQAVNASLKGEAPAAVEVPGLHFVAVDVETANADWGSVCQIGVSKVIDGAIVESDAWLCKPPATCNAFEPTNVAIHGITEADVRDAVDYPEAVQRLLDFTEDLPLVAHNAQFDMTALRRAGLAADAKVPSTSFGCSLALARAAKMDVRNHRLPTVAKHLDVLLDQHHDAGADARACAGIVVKLAQRAGVEGSLAEVMHALGFAPGEVNEDRVYPVLRDRTVDVADDVTIEAVTEQQQRKQPKPRQPWAKVATPDEIPEPNTDADPNGNLFGQVVVLSGDFEPYSKGELWQAMAKQGATVAKNVTKKTTILISGPWEGKTSKLKRAEELQAKGQDIAIWSKEELLTQLGLGEQPPF